MLNRKFLLIYSVEIDVMSHYFYESYIFMTNRCVWLLGLRVFGVVTVSGEYFNCTQYGL